MGTPDGARQERLEAKSLRLFQAWVTDDGYVQLEALLQSGNDCRQRSGTERPAGKASQSRRRRVLLRSCHAGRSRGSRAAKQQDAVNPKRSTATAGKSQRGSAPARSAAPSCTGLKAWARAPISGLGYLFNSYWGPS